MGGVERITQLDDTHTHWVTKIGGVEREFDAEITEQHPEERIAWTSTSGEAKHAGVVTFHRLDDATTRVMIQIDWEPEGLVEKAGAALGFDDRQVKADAKKFKEFIESRGTETGAWRGGVALVRDITPRSVGLRPSPPVCLRFIGIRLRAPGLIRVHPPKKRRKATVM